MKVAAQTLLLILMAIGVCQGGVIEVDLSRMVQESDLIVIARAIQIEEKAVDEPFHAGVVTLEIEQTIEGVYSGKKIRVNYAPLLSVEPRFLIGERCIFFIRTSDQKNSIVRGYAGKVHIEEGMVMVGSILGEERRQALEDFVLKIRSVRTGR